MSKKKKKQKKTNPKRERYAKFRKDKPGTLDISMPDLTTEQQKQKQNDEQKFNKFLRFNRNRPILSLKDKKERERKGKK